jgi:Asp/Glu/hydantoin racemase
MAEEVQEKAGIPVIDPMAAAIQMAQVLVTMRHSQSRRAYPFPPEKRRIL